ncbi:flagellar basal body-associated protein FliL [Aquibacillus halophilus]|uniref:Flagellar protein FliL n=1 Tax=Aquibacillus halophilus TaxID=930132 RepID=A0A6A8DH85_9BACI|nr:flagellar basal body-associated FliL family protein [Aquibacillus halophilus]MRH42267.1 flagellar basal body-associated protein FliL [Aquibacillus halophilus]
MNRRLFKILISILVVLTILGVVAFVVVLNVSGEQKRSDVLSLKKMVDYSFTTSEMSTDLKDDSFVRIQFRIITDSKKAKEEIENREFQLKNIFIKESVEMEEEDLQVGLSDLEETIKIKMNELMEDGQIKEVYVIGKIVQ